MRTAATLLATLAAGIGQAQSWQLVFADEFNWNGGIDPNRWYCETGGGGWGNQELQNYTNRLENVRVSDAGGIGRLIIEARRDFYNGGEYTSARLGSQSAWTYGKMVVRAKLPGGVGTWPAIWMLPRDWTYGNGSWPDNGEIDIMEMVGYDPTSIHASIHCRNYNHTLGTQRTASTTLADATSAYHDYILEWRPDSLDVYVDSTHYFHFDREASDFARWPFDKPFQFRLNVAVGGTWGGAQGVDPAIWPRAMEIDYVRVYRAKSAPYRGVAATLPGRIEAERYDQGGEGFAYHDVDPANNGTALRADGVDIGLDARTGPYVGWLSGSEWMNYSVNVQKTALYDLRTRVASPMDGRSFYWELDDRRITPDIVIPNTGAWDRWAEVTAPPVRLTAGKHVLRLVSNWDLFNVDRVDVLARRAR